MVPAQEAGHQEANGHHHRLTQDALPRRLPAHSVIPRHSLTQLRTLAYHQEVSEPLHLRMQLGVLPRLLVVPVEGSGTLHRSAMQAVLRADSVKHLHLVVEVLSVKPRPSAVDLGNQAHRHTTVLVWPASSAVAVKAQQLIQSRGTADLQCLVLTLVSSAGVPWVATWEVP